MTDITNNFNDIPGRIKHAMKLNGYRPKELTQLTGLDKTYISKLLAGKWENPRKHIAIIADVLGVSVHWLLTGKEGSSLIEDTLQVALKDGEAKLLMEQLSRVLDRLSGDIGDSNYRQVRFCSHDLKGFVCQIPFASLVK